MRHQCLPERAVPLVGEVESGKFARSVQLWECVFRMSPDCRVHNVILRQPGVILFTQGKVGHRAFGVVAKNAIIVVQFHLSLCGNAVFRMDMADIDAHAGEILLQLCAVVIVTHPGNASRLYAVASAVHRHIDRITARKRFIQLRVDIDAVIADCRQGFHLSSSGSSARKRSSAWRA